MEYDIYLHLAVKCRVNLPYIDEIWVGLEVCNATRYDTTGLSKEGEPKLWSDQARNVWMRKSSWDSHGNLPKRRLESVCSQRFFWVVQQFNHPKVKSGNFVTWILHLGVKFEPLKNPTNYRQNSPNLTPKRRIIIACPAEKTTCDAGSFPSNKHLSSIAAAGVNHAGRGGWVQEFQNWWRASVFFCFMNVGFLYFREGTLDLYACILWYMCMALVCARDVLDILMMNYVLYRRIHL